MTSFFFVLRRKGNDAGSLESSNFPLKIDENKYKKLPLSKSKTQSKGLDKSKSYRSQHRRQSLEEPRRSLNSVATEKYELYGQPSYQNSKSNTDRGYTTNYLEPWQFRQAVFPNYSVENEQWWHDGQIRGMITNDYFMPQSSSGYNHGRSFVDDHRASQRMNDKIYQYAKQNSNRASYNRNYAVSNRRTVVANLPQKKAARSHPGVKKISPKSIGNPFKRVNIMRAKVNGAGKAKTGENGGILKSSSKSRPVMKKPTVVRKVVAKKSGTTTAAGSATALLKSHCSNLLVNVSKSYPRNADCEMVALTAKESNAPADLGIGDKNHQPRASTQPSKKRTLSISSRSVVSDENSVKSQVGVSPSKCPSKNLPSSTVLDSKTLIKLANGHVSRKQGQLLKNVIKNYHRTLRKSRISDIEHVPGGSFEFSDLNPVTTVDLNELPSDILSHIVDIVNSPVEGSLVNDVQVVKSISGGVSTSEMLRNLKFELIDKDDVEILNILNYNVKNQLAKQQRTDPEVTKSRIQPSPQKSSFAPVCPKEKHSAVTKVNNSLNLELIPIDGPAKSKNVRATPSVMLTSKKPSVPHSITRMESPKTSGSTQTGTNDNIVNSSVNCNPHPNGRTKERSVFRLSENSDRRMFNNKKIVNQLEGVANVDSAEFRVNKSATDVQMNNVQPQTVGNSSRSNNSSIVICRESNKAVINATTEAVCRTRTKPSSTENTSVANAVPFDSYLHEIAENMLPCPNKRLVKNSARCPPKTTARSQNAKNQKTASNRLNTADLSHSHQKIDCIAEKQDEPRGEDQGTVMVENRKSGNAGNQSAVQSADDDHSRATNQERCADENRAMLCSEDGPRVENEDQRAAEKQHGGRAKHGKHVFNREYLMYFEMINITSVNSLTV